MIRYKSTKPIEIFDFAHPFQTELDPENRWVKLSKLLDCDELVQIYSRSMSSTKGKYGIDGRLAVGSLIIKHLLGLSDREVIETLKENVYLQYFVGFTSFHKEAEFDASLFVELRKRMSAEKFDQMNKEIIHRSETIKPSIQNRQQEKREKKKLDEPETASGEKQDHRPTDNAEGKETCTINNPVAHRGKLKLDATVSDQMIVYPTDLGLLNRAHEESERLIDILYKKSGTQKKPRTYRREARQAYLQIARKKNKSKKLLRKAIGKQLRYVRRNIKHIHTLIDLFEGGAFPLGKRKQKIFWAIQLIYWQQEEMYREKKHSIPHRIVNIYQPYVRPIPRGKEKASIEFGTKLGVSEVDGFVRYTHA